MKQTALILSVAALHTVMACNPPAFGNCGNAQGSTCCPGNFYCQPWNPGYYQCLQNPAQCQQQFTDIDFFGNDIETVYGLQPSECCTRCSQTNGCKAYTFVNNNPGRTACYLKSGVGQSSTLVGAVSGIVNGGGGPSPPPPSSPTPSMTPSPPTCSTPQYGQCGDSRGATCCQSGQYCQPWSTNYYQCVQPPAQCQQQFTDVDFPGNDIATIYGLQPGD
ncbi:hypothetical protein As57867_007783, partial [Aphanomyces stellatus]